MAILYSGCECIIAGDFNSVLDSNDAVAKCVISLINNCSLVHCDDLFLDQKVDTCVNLSLCQNSQIDYILVSKASDVANFYVSDPDINYSCLLYTSPSPRDRQKSRMPSSA